MRTRPFPSWPIFDESDEKAVVDVVRSGAWGLGGQKNKEFEAKYAEYHDAAYGIVLSNGTVALQVALTALGVGPGDEVIVPAYTFVATGAAVLQTGAIPVIVDIDPETYTLDPDATEAAITERTRCIIPVHVAGNPAHMDRFVALSEKYNIPILEDAAQAHGAKWNDRGVGSLGALGTFSFQSTKNLASGEGGIILTNDSRLADLCRALRDSGRFEGTTDHPPVLGWNYRMTEFQSAILLSQMERLDDQISRREQSATYLAAELSKIPGVVPAKRDAGVTRHAYHLFVFKLDEAKWGLSLERFLQGLHAEGIPCSQGYVPLYRDPLLVTSGRSCASSWPGLDNDWASKDYANMHLPHAEVASQSAVWLPQNVLLGDETDMDDIVAAIQKLWDNREALVSVQTSGEGIRYAGLS